ncbi:MAG: flagellar biosynthetic protein FliO [Armatimonadota bacterium]|nr:flagellar biosynthetic protein FliO [Armatimonadota bacterium]
MRKLTLYIILAIAGVSGILFPKPNTCIGNKAPSTPAKLSLCIILAIFLVLIGTRQVIAQQPRPQGVQLTVAASELAWVKVRVDGRTVFQGNLRPGWIKTWRAEKVIYFETGNAGGVRLSLNGRKLNLIGRRGQVTTRIFIAPPPSPKPQKPMPPPQPVPKPKPPPPESKPQPVPQPALPEPSPQPVERPVKISDLPEAAAPYISLFALIILLVVSIWMFVILRRENRLYSVLSAIALGPERNIKVVASQRLSRKSAVYLLEIGDRLFLTATGPVEFLTELSKNQESQ